MQKVMTLLLCFLLSGIGLSAQNHTFRDFDVEKGDRQNFIIKPKTYDSLLQSLKIDTLFSLGIKFDDFSIMDSYMKQLRNWENELLAKVIPEQVRDGVQYIMNEDSLPCYVADHHLYINLLVDSTGNILSVYFKTSADVLKAMTEEQEAVQKVKTSPLKMGYLISVSNRDTNKSRVPNTFGIPSYEL